MALVEDRLVIRPPHHVPTSRQRTEGGAVVGLPAGDRADALGLADFQKILPGQLDGGLIPLGAGRAEPGSGQAVRFVVEKNLRQILCRLIGKGAGMSIGQRGGLSSDGLGDATIAVTETGDGGPARCIDDAASIVGVEIDAFAADGDRGNGAEAVEDAAHAVTPLVRSTQRRRSCTSTPVKRSPTFRSARSCSRKA
jgi:hypothetical protein